MKLPNGERAGERVLDQVSLIDVAPAVAEVMELPVPPTFQGSNLLASDPSRSASGTWSETEHTLDGSHLLAVRRGATGEKTIFVKRDDSISGVGFDLTVDPGEHRPRDAGAVALKELSSFLRDASELRGGKRAVPPVELDEEQRERLRALGYTR